MPHPSTAYVYPVRLILFARTDYKFGSDSPNVLHMTIKPQDYVEEEDAKGGKSTYSANRESESRSPGCRCIIM